MKKQSGFTLIELIVVIVILGILAATALPKFVDIGQDARAGVMRGVEASMRSANAMIYAKAATGNFLSAGPNTVVINGQNVSTTYGFAADVANLVLVLDISPATDFDYTTVSTEIEHKKAPTPSTCRVAYTPASGVNTPPSYATITTGC